MKGITVKFPEKILQQLRQRARLSGRSVSSLVRELVERELEKGETVYAMTADQAGFWRAGLKRRRVRGGNSGGDGGYS